MFFHPVIRLFFLVLLFSNKTNSQNLFFKIKNNFKLVLLSIYSFTLVSIISMKQMIILILNF